MTWLYFWLLMAGVTALVVWVMVQPRRVFEYPYFMAAALGVFILPQCVSLLRFPGGAPESAISAVLLMSCLCLAACWIGYQLPINRTIAYHAARPINPQRLFHVGLAFIASAYFFHHLIGRMADEETGGTMWTGRVTIYHFFTLLVFPGFAIALRTALNRGDLLAWFASAVASLLPLRAAIFAGRRE